jgi:peptidoglycan biosynthesis protein MviN/MurJ (putative lipid II flippase)
MKTGLDALLMTIFLTRKIGGLHHYDLLPLAFKVLLASLIMGAVVYGVVNLIQAQQDNRTFLNSAIIAAGGALAGVLVYAISALLLGIREIRNLRSFIKG